MVGQVIGTYRIVSRLGAGGMGAVWLAEHTLLGRRVAIKVLLPQVSQQAPMVERFFDEARAATRVDHPGIVAVHDFGWHSDGSAYIVMEHLTGEPLSARLRRAGHLAAGDALRIVQQAAIAMAAAHGGGIVHRDLKPDNIFVVPDPAVTGGERIKILDFGIAKLVGDESSDHSRTQTGVIMGTPMYMSPEQCRNAGGVDHRTDIYSLGCVLFHLLTGRPPFTAPTTGDMIASHLMEEPPAPSTVVTDIPPPVDALVLRCLAKAADERPADMNELANLIARLRATGDAGDADAPGGGADVGLLRTLAQGAAVPPPSPPRWRRRTRVAAGLAVVVAALAAIVIAMSRGGGGGARPAPAGVPSLSPSVPSLVDAAVVAPSRVADAGVDAAPASTAPGAPGRGTKRGRVGPRRPGGEYDPYADR